MPAKAFDTPIIGEIGHYTGKYGLSLHPGAQVVAYVRSTGAVPGDPDFVRAALAPSIASVATRPRAGRGDVIAVLPGHTETISEAASLNTIPSDTIVLGYGNDPAQSSAPTITFSATAAQIIPTGTGIRFVNLRFTASANVVAAIAPTGSGLTIDRCYINTNNSTAQMVTFLTLASSSSDRALIKNCWFDGTAANPTTGATIVLGATSDSPRIIGNVFMHGAVTTTGFISIPGATVRLLIDGNRMYNLTASSTACISIADAASDGLVSNNRMACTSGGTSAAEGILVTGTGSLIHFDENYNTSDPRASGILCPAVAT